jgi:hypothetical protein
MKPINYKKAYYEFVRQENLEKLKIILKELQYYDDSIIENIQFKRKDDLSYFCALVDSPEYTGNRSYTMLDGIFIEIESIIPAYTEIFYLPVIMIRKVKEKLKQFVNLPLFEKHELHHLKELIDYIDRNPDYIEKAMKYNIGSCSLDNIHKSIEFELNKVFLLEVPAFEFDFENGDRDFLFYSDGVVTKIPVDTKQRFVAFHISSYAANLRQAYLERFPGNEELVNETIRKELNKQGRRFFGENATTQAAFALLELAALSNNDLYSKKYEVGEV